MVLALGMDSKKRLKSTFFFFSFFFLIIKTFRFMESVTLKEWKIKDMGERRQWQCQGGSVTDERCGLRWPRCSQRELAAAHG